MSEMMIDYAFDLPEWLPLVRLDVFEICDPRSHTQQWPPSNVELTTHDVLAKITNESVERYDVIHLRFLLLEFQPEWTFTQVASQLYLW